MNQGPNPPAGNAGGKGRRRRRRRGGGAPPQPGQQQGKPQGPSQPHGQSQPHGKQFSPHQGPAKHAGGKRFKKRTGGHKGGGGGQRPSQHEPLGGVYSAPMDHSYRAVLGDSDGNVHIPDRNWASKSPGASEPPPVPLDAPTKIYAFIDDLFFFAKINETARKLGIKVEFVKSEKEVFERMEQNGNEKPSLILVDLNNLGVKPLTVIPKLKSKLKKETNIIGFVSHVQGELKMKAQEAGCDMVLPRSAFSQNLAQLMRRHTASDEDLNDHGQPV